MRATQISFHKPTVRDKKVSVGIWSDNKSHWAHIQFAEGDVEITLFDTPDEICEWLACLGAEITTALTWYQSEADVCKPHGNPAVTQFCSGGVAACSKQCAAEQLE